MNDASFASCFSGASSRRPSEGGQSDACKSLLVVSATFTLGKHRTRLGSHCTTRGSGARPFPKLGYILETKHSGRYPTGTYVRRTEPEMARTRRSPKSSSSCKHKSVENIVLRSAVHRAATVAHFLEGCLEGIKQIQQALIYLSGMIGWRPCFKC